MLLPRLQAPHPGYREPTAINEGVQKECVERNQAVRRWRKKKVKKKNWLLQQHPKETRAYASWKASVHLAATLPVFRGSDTAAERTGAFYTAPTMSNQARQGRERRHKEISMTNSGLLLRSRQPISWSRLSADNGSSTYIEGTRS